MVCPLFPFSDPNYFENGLPVNFQNIKVKTETKYLLLFTVYTVEFEADAGNEYELALEFSQDNSVKSKIKQALIFEVTRVLENNKYLRFLNK
ncbi:MAG: hypothetical protein V3U87_07675 [Methylococcaceae bacterium]